LFYLQQAANKMKHKKLGFIHANCRILPYTGLLTCCTEQNVIVTKSYRTGKGSWVIFLACIWIKMSKQMC